MHQRLREYPVTGGASTLRVSIRRQDILELGTALLKALNWFGVAMVEFKLDPRDGQPKLMELNPRFWGSLALAEPAGVNFPYLLFRMACGEKLSGRPVYRTGIRCRWLLHGDLLHFIHSPKRHRLLGDFFKFRQPGLTYDILSLRDPFPVLGRLLMPLTLLYDKDMKARMKMRK
jgi:predicted ATP-grasp superfamily ATP-dependent carboligase